MTCFLYKCPKINIHFPPEKYPNYENIYSLLSSMNIVERDRNNYDYYLSRNQIALVYVSLYTRRIHPSQGYTYVPLRS